MLLLLDYIRQLCINTNTICCCCEMLVLRFCGTRQNFYAFRLNRNSDLIYDCLLTWMAAVQAKELPLSSLFAGDLNGHNQEWLGSTTMYLHGVAAFDFDRVVGNDQLVVDQTHLGGDTVDLLCLTVSTWLNKMVAHIWTSDYSSISAVSSPG